MFSGDKMLKKGLSAILIMLAIALVLVSTASAAALLPTYHKPGPFEGVFTGMVSGDKKSQAPITLTLAQRGEEIQGSVVLGEGLYVDGGMCYAGELPATEQSMVTKIKSDDPRRLETRLLFNVSNVQIAVDLESELSADGQELAVITSIDLPWFCGRDPVLKGELVRVETK
jgi:hypothetical protein